MGLPEAGPCLPEASLGLPKAGLCQNRPLEVQSQILGGPRQAMLVFEARVSPWETSCPLGCPSQLLAGPSHLPEGPSSLWPGSLGNQNQSLEIYSQPLGGPRQSMLAFIKLELAPRWQAICRQAKTSLSLRRPKPASGRPKPASGRPKPASWKPKPASCRLKHASVRPKQTSGRLKWTSGRPRWAWEAKTIS